MRASDKPADTDLDSPVLDRLAYEQQGGGLRRGPKTTFDPSEALADVKASSDALDAILKRL